MSQEEIKSELIKLFEPCKQMCIECGAKCCQGCVHLKDGLCTERRLFCLLHYCDKIENKYPEIVNKIKQITKQLYPEAAKQGIEIKLKWVEKAQDDQLKKIA
jgi:hypothetical protein